MSVAPEDHHVQGDELGARPDLRVVGRPSPQTAPPRLRLLSLPHPCPAPWDPNPATRYADLAPAAAQRAFVLHAVPRPVASDPAFEDAVATPVTELPCPEDLARRLIQAVVDVVRGHRPASQVLRWTTPEVYSQLRQRARLEQASPRPGGRRPVVRSLRTHPGGPHGIEVSAVVLDGTRARAVAARLDGEDSRWRLTALSIG